MDTQKKISEAHILFVNFSGFSSEGSSIPLCDPKFVETTCSFLGSRFFRRWWQCAKTCCSEALAQSPFETTRQCRWMTSAPISSLRPKTSAKM